MSKTAGKSRRTLSGAKRSLRLNRGTLAFVLTSRAGALHRSDERPTGRGGIPSRLHRQALKGTMHVAVVPPPPPRGPRGGRARRAGTPLGGGAGAGRLGAAVGRGL